MPQTLERRRELYATDPIYRAKANAASRLYQAQHFEELRPKRLARYQLNRERLLEQKREYGRRNVTRLRLRQSYRSDSGRRLGLLLRTRIRKALSGRTASAPLLGLIGCSVDELKDHLERQFQPGMSWDNYGYRGWHVDHKIPCASFELNDPGQQRECFHYSNLQPLWMEDNLKKGPRT